MFWKITFFGVALLLSVSANNSIEDKPIAANKLVKIPWSSTMELLSNTISGLTADFNLTLVAYQNVYNDDKTLKEIKTIELSIPKLVAPSIQSEDSSEEDDEDSYQIFKDVKKVFDELSSAGLGIQVSHEEYKSDGTVINELYFDNNVTYMYDEGLGYLNKTIIGTKEDVENYIKKHQGNVLPMAVLRYDVDGNFIEEGSQIAPSAMTSITDMYEADNEIVKEALAGFSLVNLKYPSEIPKKLSLHMKEKFPNYYWHVTSDTDAYFLKRDVSVTVQNEIIDVPEEIIKPYTIWGSKKQ